MKKLLVAGLVLTVAGSALAATPQPSLDKVKHKPVNKNLSSNLVRHESTATRPAGEVLGRQKAVKAPSGMTFSTPLEAEYHHLKETGQPIPAWMVTEIFGTQPEGGSRQGGETFASATAITFQAGGTYTDSGTTVGSVDNILTNQTPPAMCNTSFYATSSFAAGDVVYTFTLPAAYEVSATVCNNASYDSCLGIFNASQALVAVNDDGAGCTNWSSQIDPCCLQPGNYYIVVDGYGTATGTYTLTVNFGATPCEVGDPCEDATVLGCGDSVTGTTVGGTNYVGNGAPDVFYELEIGEAGPVTLSLCNGTDYDSYLRVYDACPTEGGVELASNDDACGLQSEITMAMEATTYWVVVEGFGTGAGNYTLDVVCVTCDEITCVGDDEGEPNNGPADFGGDDTYGSIECGLASTVCGTTWADGGTRDTDWFEFTLIDATEVTGSVYCSAPTATFLIDTSCPPAVLATGSGGCPNSWTRCLPPGTYRAFVALTVFDGFPCFGSSANDYVLTLSGIPCDASAPKNDECETAQRISDGNTFFDTSFASTSPIPLDPSCDEGFGTAFVQDLWFKYTASCDGICTASTCSQASFDTRLAAYTDCFGSLVGCNDDGADCAGLTSELIFPVSAGNDYYIRVGGFSGGGTGTLSISCSKAAGNDECEGATPVGDGDTSFDTTGATTSPLALDPQCDEGFGVAFVKDLWFAYQASCTGTVTVSTCNAASYDTRLAVYSDCNGTLVACNDDAAGCDLTSSLQFSSTAGSTYYIRVGGYAAGGSGTLSVSCTKGGGGCTSNDTCACATAIALGDTAFNTTGASSDAPTASPAFCGAFGTGFFRDVWFAYTPTEAGHLTVSTCNQATYDTRLELWSGCPSDGSSVVLACNDDGEGCATFTSFMEADVSCGATYYVRVGSYSSGTTGSGTLTLALTSTTPCAPPCPADINGDGQVNGADLGLLIGNWGGSGTGDLNNDGLVNGADLGILIGNWGPCPT